MDAIVLRSYGGPEVMELTPTSRVTPGQDEVLVRTRAVGLNPVDALQREGVFRALDPSSLVLMMRSARCFGPR